MAPGGLVKDAALRIAARDEIVRFGKEELSLELLGLEESPIRGREMGNVEYLSYWRKRQEGLTPRGARQIPDSGACP